MRNETNRLIYVQLAPGTVAAAALTFPHVTLLLPGDWSAIDTLLEIRERMSLVPARCSEWTATSLQSGTLHVWQKMFVFRPSRLLELFTLHHRHRVSLGSNLGMWCLCSVRRMRHSGPLGQDHYPTKNMDSALIFSFTFRTTLSGMLEFYLIYVILRISSVDRHSQ